MFYSFESSGTAGSSRGTGSGSSTTVTGSELLKGGSSSRNDEKYLLLPLHLMSIKLSYLNFELKLLVLIKVVPIYKVRSTGCFLSKGAYSVAKNKLCEVFRTAIVQLQCFKN